MAWGRFGDEINGAPEFGRALELAVERGDDRLVLELKGAAFTLAAHSAQQYSDYRISWGDVISLIGLSRAADVVADLIAVGILFEDEPVDGRRQFRLLKRKNFFHLIESDTNTRATRRRNDMNRGGLQVPVMLRDGDQCRYCAEPVVWGDRKSDQGREYDHLDIASPTTTENYVTACRGCNGLRHELGERAELELPLLEPPTDPVYGPELLKKLSRWHALTARWCKKVGIPNPLEGEVEPQGDPAAGRAAPPSPITESHAAPSSPATDTRQVSSQPQFPTDSPRVESGGRAANGSPQQPAGGTHTIPVPPVSPEPPVAQAGCDPQGRSVSHVRDAGPANEAPRPARRRRRRRR